ncbi:MAG: ABC transporter permease subunit, partial [Acidobacteriota bacterium]
VRGLLDTYNRNVAGQRLLVRGLSPELMQAVSVQRLDFSTTTSRAARMLLMLPIFLLMSTFVGGMNVAIDVTAGERERVSLESLLVHPVSRLSLVAGKWGAATLLNFAVVFLTLAVSVAVLNSPKLQSLELRIGLGVDEALAALALLVPLVLFGPAIQMLISTFARSFKEAQTYLSLLILLPALPGFFFAFQTAKPEPWMDRIPLLGHQTLITTALRGESLGFANPALLAAATVIAALLCIVVTGRLLQDERIVLTR